MVAAWGFLLDNLTDDGFSIPSNFTLMQLVDGYNVSVHQVARLTVRQMTGTKYRMTFSYCHNSLKGQPVNFHHACGWMASLGIQAPVELPALRPGDV